MTYFHMGRPHTIIGAEWFHFRVRDGIGWYPNAVVAGRTGWQTRSGDAALYTPVNGTMCVEWRARTRSPNWRVVVLSIVIAHPVSGEHHVAHNNKQLLGCYMVKPHGQLVQVSFTHCCASTPCLSTLWSSRALQESQGFSENSSWEGLPA